MNKLSSFFKVVGDSKQLSFGIKSKTNFNYIDVYREGKINSNLMNHRSILTKQMEDSYRLDVYLDDKYSDNIKELKLTNQNLYTWEDYWIDSDKILVDPKIESINLQKNSLIHANFNLKREYLTRVNLEGNLDLSAIFITESPKLEILNLSNCPSLRTMTFGINRNVKAFFLRNCRLPGFAQERVLRDFTPIQTNSMNNSVNVFRKEYTTVLDMRGNEIDWSNRKVASKIRLLLCNNWMVLWDNPPPTSIVPAQMYSFFTNNLEEKLIKEYYG